MLSSGPSAELVRASCRAALLSLLALAAPSVARGQPAVVGGPSGKVLERLDAAPYTYLRLRGLQGETWVAVPQADVAPGAEVSVSGAMPMHAFESKTLNRRFDLVWFGTLAIAEAAARPEQRPAREPSDDARPLEGSGVSVVLAEGETRPRNLKAVWASSATDAWAVGYQCEILRWDGTAWSIVSGGRVEGRTTTLCGEPREPADMFHAVWGSSANDVWVVGGYKRRTTVLHWDGAAWSRTSSDGWDLTAVWGTSAGDVWAFGRHGTILHWDGASWTRVASPLPGGEVAAAWGSSATDVWAVGSDVDYGYRRSPRAAILHWDGRGWTSVPSGTTFEKLSGVWGSSATDVWTVGSGALLHWDGRSWSPAAGAGDPGELASVWGSSPRDVWTFGERIRRWDGRAWSEVCSSGATAGSGTSATDVWAVRPEGLLHWDGTGWSGDAPIASLRVAVRRAPSHPFRGLAPTIEAKSDTFVFSGADAGWRAKPVKVTIPFDPARAGFPSPYCWSPGGRGPVVDQEGRATFSGEGEFVGGQVLEADEQGRRLTFATQLLTECVLVGISQDQERAYAERQRASVRRALGITAEDETAALARAAQECEWRAAKARPPPPSGPGSAAALLRARPLAAILPTARDVAAPRQAPAPAEAPRDRPRAAFAPGVRPFELAWKIDPAERDERLSERIQLVADPCSPGATGDRSEATGPEARLVAPFRLLPSVHTAAALPPADAVPFLADVGDELHPAGDQVVKVTLALAVREEGPFFDVVQEWRPLEGGIFTEHDVTHRLVLRRAIVEGGRFSPGGRKPAAVAAVLDGLWYAGAEGLVAEAIATRETDRFVVRDYTVSHASGGGSEYFIRPDGTRGLRPIPTRHLRTLLRIAVDKRDGAAFLLPLTIAEDGKRVDGPIAVDLSTGVEYR